MLKPIKQIRKTIVLLSNEEKSNFAIRFVDQKKLLAQDEKVNYNNFCTSQIIPVNRKKIDYNIVLQEIKKQYFQLIK